MGQRIGRTGRRGRLPGPGYRERTGRVTQFDVARLAHNVVGVGDDEVWESAVVFFESVGAFGVRLAGHFCAEIGELFAELLNL